MSERLPKFKAAAVQAAPVFLDHDGTLKKAISLTEEAAAAGARLVVFPETWVPCFPFWYLHIFRWNYPPAKKAYARLYQNSVEVPGPFTEALGQAARKAGVYIAMGINERVASGTLYNSMIFIGDDGALLGNHRKLIPTYHERMVWGQGDGSTLQVYDTGLGRLGGLICYEHWMPLARYAVEAQGAQVFASVWPSIYIQTSLMAAQHMAAEGRCFVVMSCAYMKKDQLPEDFELLPDLKDIPETLYNGGSSIIGPDGRFLAEPVYDREDIIYAEIDLERILEEKQMLDVAGHYARPEVLQLIHQRQAYSPYQALGETSDLEKELSRLETLSREASAETLREELHKLRQRYKKPF